MEPAERGGVEKHTDTLSHRSLHKVHTDDMDQNNKTVPQRMIVRLQSSINTHTSKITHAARNNGNLDPIVSEEHFQHIFLLSAAMVQWLSGK